jgi:hypothetical protein
VSRANWPLVWAMRLQTKVPSGHGSCHPSWATAYFSAKVLAELPGALCNLEISRRVQSSLVGEAASLRHRQASRSGPRYACFCRVIPTLSDLPARHQRRLGVLAFWRESLEPAPKATLNSAEETPQ